MKKSGNYEKSLNHRHNVFCQIHGQKIKEARSPRPNKSFPFCKTARNTWTSCIKTLIFEISHYLNSHRKSLVRYRFGVCGARFFPRDKWITIFEIRRRFSVIARGIILYPSRHISMRLLTARILQTIQFTKCLLFIPGVKYRFGFWYALWAGLRVTGIPGWTFSPMNISLIWISRHPLARSRHLRKTFARQLASCKPDFV